VWRCLKVWSFNLVPFVILTAPSHRLRVIGL
jgi:hypothetical protein